MKYWIPGAAIVLIGIVLPVQSILDWGSRFSTVAGFRADYEKGLQVVRIALVLNGLLVAALPWLLARMRYAEPAPDARPELWPMAALYVLAAALIAPGMTSSFQQDEWRCLTEYVRHGPFIILTRSVEADNHTLYSLLAWPFVRIFGMSEIAARIPALLLTALAPALLFAILRRSYSLPISMLGALPLAASVFLIFYGHEGRGYGPQISAFLALWWLRPRMLNGTIRDWWIYVIAGAACVGLQLFGAIGVLAIALASIRRGVPLVRNAAALVVTGALSLLLYAPVLPQYFATSDLLTSGPRFNEPLSVLLSDPFVGHVRAWWALPFAGALYLSLRSPESRAPLLAAGIATALLAGLLEMSGAAQSTRYYTATLALLWIPIAIGIATTFTACRPGGLITALAILAASAVADVAYYRLGKQDFRRAARELEARMKPGETLISFFDGRPMTAYLSKPPRVVNDEPDVVMRERPDWFVIVSGNLERHPKLRAWVEQNYRLEFALPSTATEVRGYRLISSR